MQFHPVDIVLMLVLILKPSCLVSHHGCFQEMEQAK